MLVGESSVSLLLVTCSCAGRGYWKNECNLLDTVGKYNFEDCNSCFQDTAKQEISLKEAYGGWGCYLVVNFRVSSVTLPVTKRDCKGQYSGGEDHFYATSWYLAQWGLKAAIFTGQNGQPCSCPLTAIKCSEPGYLCWWVAVELLAFTGEFALLIN